jgi:hypothetical protein
MLRLLRGKKNRFRMHTNETSIDFTRSRPLDRAFAAGGSPNSQDHMAGRLSALVCLAIHMAVLLTLQASIREDHHWQSTDSGGIGRLFVIQFVNLSRAEARCFITAAKAAGALTAAASDQLKWTSEFMN